MLSSHVLKLNKFAMCYLQLNTLKYTIKMIVFALFLRHKLKLLSKSCVFEVFIHMSLYFSILNIVEIGCILSIRSTCSRIKICFPLFQNFIRSDAFMVYIFYYFHAGGELCRLLITLANGSGSYQERQNNLDTNSLIL